MNQHERCECHDCTQARWKMSFQGQMSAGVVPYGPYSSDGAVNSGTFSNPTIVVTAPESYTVTDHADLTGCIHHWTHSSLKGD